MITINLKTILSNEVGPRRGPTSSKGFTLIEVLVAASIIAILASIALVNYQAVNKKSRDGKRKVDLEQVRSALEIYRVDTNQYPAALGSLVTPTPYIQAIPTDPKSPTYQYRYSGAANSYTLCAYLEGGAVTTGCTGACGGDCITTPPTSCNYKTCNP